MSFSHNSQRHRQKEGQTDRQNRQTDNIVMPISRFCVLFNRALYLDGNNLQCDGAIQLMKPFAEQALIDAEAAAAALADTQRGTRNGLRRSLLDIFIHHQMVERGTRKPCCRKDNRAMRQVYGDLKKFRIP